MSPTHMLALPPTHFLSHSNTLSDMQGNGAWEVSEASISNSSILHSGNLKPTRSAVQGNVAWEVSEPPFPSKAFHSLTHSLTQVCRAPGRGRSHGGLWGA